MSTGTIKFFNAQKGFGFIVADDGSKEIFLPLASLTGLDTARLKPGQRLSFEIETEARGPKAVSITLLERAPPPVTLSLYHDPSDGEAEEVLEALRAQGCQVREIDVLKTPPTPQDLKTWSLLSGGLVRRFDPMFHALQLDDRFIGQDEFWTAVSEHPVLIETPLLVSKSKVSVCHTADDVSRFLNPVQDVEVPRTKTLSPRLAALIRGEAIADLPPPSPKEPDEPEIPAPAVPLAPVAAPRPVPAAAAPVKDSPVAASTTAPQKPAKVAVPSKPAARKAAPAPKAAAKAKPAPKAKPAAKTKAPAKKTKARR